MLATTGRLDEAAAVSRTARIEGAEAILRRAYEATVSVQRELNAPAALGRGLSPRQRADLESLFGAASPAEEKEPAYTDADVRHAALARLEEARLGLLAAAVEAGRADIARETADRLIGSDQVTEGLVGATPALVKAASPAQAVSWLERLETHLQAYDPVRDADPPRQGYPGLRTHAEVVEETRGAQLSLDLQRIFSAVARGWRALNQSERVEALIRRWRPQVDAEMAAHRLAQASGKVVQTPYAWQLSRLLLELGREPEAQAIGVLSPGDYIRRDIELDRTEAVQARLAAVADPSERRSAAITCWHAAMENRSRSLTTARACWETQVALADSPEHKLLSAGSGLELAAGAARLGDAKAASELLTRALRMARDAPPAEPALEDTGVMARFDLLTVIKAELRAAGRLPPQSKDQPT
jgi:hypothetical protein